MIKPLGPDGVRQRMDEIAARLEQLNPRPPAQSFQSVLDKAGSGPLSGPIGAGGFAPLNPGSPNVVVTPSPGELRAMVQKAAVSQNLPEELLNAVVSVESGHNPGAESDKGAMGLMQLMPATASSLGVTNPFDPMQNLMGGARYLRGLIDRFGDLRTALAAYNAGPNRIKDTARPWPATTESYVNKVLGLYKGTGAG